MTETSPFHPGERAAQARAGVGPEIAEIGGRFIRDAMPDQHRAFFAQLPFIVAGAVDPGGRPWASILSAAPGFVFAPDARRLTIAARPPDGDPIALGLTGGAPIGLLGIEPSTRRRNRLNARIAAAGSRGLDLTVEQSFGNCPQYIQARNFEPAPNVPQPPQILSTLDAEARVAIRSADTFFVASHAHDGVDVSHRGGPAGFVRVDGDTLTIPDFSGNRFFQTLGNLLENPRAGLLFPDFETGDLLSLTGTVDILWDGDAQTDAFDGAERVWRFTLARAVRLRAALPFRAIFGGYAPEIAALGSWAEAAKRTDGWRPFRITKVEDESTVIRSFHLAPDDGGPLRDFRPGQFLTLRLTPDGTETPVIRTYTLSSAPRDEAYRISVKREGEGLVSRHLHDRMTAGDVVEVKAPTGDFYLTDTDRPAILLAGGVGVTPMISIARHVAGTGQGRRLHVFHAARTTAERAFAADFRALDAARGGAIRYHAVLGRPAASDVDGTEYHATGRIDADLLRRNLPLDDYEVYLCGPPGFMQATYEACRALGIADARIFAEAFGPASITRDPDAGSSLPVPEAETAMIAFTSGPQVAWTEGGPTLLEAAEAAGLAPASSCRTGRCGTCAAKLLKGDIAYRTKPAALPDDGEILVCCAVPAPGTGPIEIDL
ncbi:MAG: pyridoxamine 5'-phosphate oxidase family protein [Pseudomonadota bacterium]